MASYTYNAQGQRSRKEVNGVTTLYHYDLNGLLISQHVHHVDPAQSEHKDTLWVDGQPLAQIQGVGQQWVIEEDPGPIGTYTPPTAAQIEAAKKILPIIYMLLLDDDTSNNNPPPPDPSITIEVTYIHTDHLNTPRYMTDLDQTEVWRWDSKAFGNTVPNEDPDGDLITTSLNLRFPGQYFDGESGLYYNWNRYYDPEIGRYITSDPIGLQGGINTFGYVGQNPVRYVDPTGLIVEICGQPAFGFSWNPIDHEWIRTDTLEAGMGPVKSDCGNAGNESGDLPGDPVQVCDHSDRDMTGTICRVVEHIDENRVNAELEMGRQLGPWLPWNQCQSFVLDVIRKGRSGCIKTRTGWRCD